MDLSDNPLFGPWSSSMAMSPGIPARRMTQGESDGGGSALVVRDASPRLSDDLVDGLRRSGLVARTCRTFELTTLLREGAWDVVILDSPSDSDAAIRSTRLVRRSFPANELPILVLGTPHQAGAGGLALEAGANDWIAHPVDLAELSRTLIDLTELSRLRRLHRIEEERIQHELSSRSASLDALIESQLMMSMERDRPKLLNRLLTEARRLLNCDGATMYMVTDEKTLRFELRTRDDALPAQQIALFDAATGAPNESYVSVYTAIHNQSVLIDDVYTERRFDLSGTRAFDASSGYRTVSMLTVPIAPRGGEPIGVLQFMNAQHPRTGQIVPFAPEMVGLVEALAAQAAVALDNIDLVDSQKRLMESLIRVLATAIDAKSPYTGRHCERVPELAFLLAEAACKVTEGPLADFAFRNEQEWQEFRIGAWLHDCGKVTTPEYVIDKATKLETIYNRIHEIRTRFEVILRDLEIERLRAELRDGPDIDRDAEFSGRRAALMDDYAFVARCNIGSEAMQEADVDRLARIADTPWIRHFDDRLGISGDESARRGPGPSHPAPVVEALLADRAHHIVARPDEQAQDTAFGFEMDIPEHLYNHGELYNLSVRRGTLTVEERYKINEHMVHTIMMLERMPFPKDLRRVPEYAGTHHERIDGKGYPRRLSGSELSVPSRIMAVADIFEALTASDRPYKESKKLSEALRVLQTLAGDHIDVDIFNLFLSSGVFLEFARKHLKPDQIDVIDGSAYLVPVGHV